jgi:tetratricopeptide (TPR) repeat protein
LIQAYARRQPQDFEGSLSLGAAYRGLGRYAEAEGPLEQAVRMQPNYYEARYNLGFALRRLGKLHQALVHLEKARA